jgi:hypothetical protein
VEEEARSDEIMSQDIIVANIAINRLGFSRKSKGATIGTAAFEGSAIGKIKRQAWQGLWVKQMLGVWHAATA